MPALELLTDARDGEVIELSAMPDTTAEVEWVRAPGDAPFPVLRVAATRAAGVVIAFPAFRDGRGLTLAARLRETGYRGRIEAEGHVLPDQARHLARCGFDAVRLSGGAVIADWRRMLEAFSAVYQPDETGGVPVWNLRAVHAG